MKSNDVRSKFLKYFESRGHKILPGSSLVPEDPTVLLTLAGMLQFKPIFLGLKSPQVSRATTVQKCVRTNDIENVGHTARHHTFFEMLGNFSFGDYFKAEAIAFAWELLTKEFNMDTDRLYIAVYEKDDESADIWTKKMGIRQDRLVRLGEDNNFWAAGPTGPCGPCSEIYYDLGESEGCGDKNCAPGCDCDRFLEIWNLVFMEFNRGEKGTLSSLPKKNIDTGMGLERITSVLQGVKTNFDTDLFVPIIEKVKSEYLKGKTFNDEKALSTALRIISDHSRAAAHLITDGVFPGNEGRNYILRRIIRRAVMSGKKLSIEGPFMSGLVNTVAALAKDFYPALYEKRSEISNIILGEEEAFGRTIDQGMEILEYVLKRSSGIVSGKDVFKLYDTYGFPLELTKETASERGLSIDIEGFNGEMGMQKDRSRKKLKTALLGEVPQVKGYPATVFTGYETLECEANVIDVIGADGRLPVQGQPAYIILDKTPFYAESGGQESDTGHLVVERNIIPVIRLVKTADGIVLHQVQSDVMPVKGEKVKAVVDRERREMIARHHTSTHLLHSALRNVLGEHVRQAGSSVGSDKFRFDFSHNQSLNDEQISRVEAFVCSAVKQSVPVETIETSLEEAKGMGATALFNEKYANKVRVIRIGGISMELCGGTHVKNTSTIGSFKIIKEGAISQGMRRIEAVSGKAAEEYIKAKAGEGEKAAATALKKEQEKEEEKKQRQEILSAADEIAKNVSDIGGVRFVTKEFNGIKPTVLKELADKIRNTQVPSISLFVSTFPDKLSIVVGVSADLVPKGYDAGKLIKELSQVIGGRGGGRSDIAEGGGKAGGNISELLNKAHDLIKRGSGK